jgi:hypothetical protein
MAFAIVHMKPDSWVLPVCTAASIPPIQALMWMLGLCAKVVTCCEHGCRPKCKLVLVTVTWADLSCRTAEAPTFRLDVPSNIIHKVALQHSHFACNHKHQLNMGLQ